MNHRGLRHLAGQRLREGIQLMIFFLNQSGPPMGRSDT
jgi:hypothetical protein